MNKRTPLHRFMNQLQEKGLVVDGKELNDLFFEYLQIEKQEMSRMFNYDMETEAGQPVSEPDFEQYFEETYSKTNKL
jgi:hypothetical protein